MSGINTNFSVDHNFSYSSATSTLSDDAADHLYFECRDTNYTHEQAIAYVKEHGALQNWEPPRTTDYKGLPDIQLPSRSSNTNSMQNPVDHSSQSQTEENRQHEINSARDRFNYQLENQTNLIIPKIDNKEFKPNFPIGNGVGFIIKKADWHNTKDRYVYRIHYKNSNGKRSSKPFQFDPNVEGSEKEAYDKAVAFKASI
jgi:hypothetical protein